MAREQAGLGQIIPFLLEGLLDAEGGMRMKEHSMWCLKIMANLGTISPEMWDKYMTALEVVKDNWPTSGEDTWPAGTIDYLNFHKDHIGHAYKEKSPDKPKQEEEIEKPEQQNPSNLLKRLWNKIRG